MSADMIFGGYKNRTGFQLAFGDFKGFFDPPQPLVDADDIIVRDSPV